MTRMLATCFLHFRAELTDADIQIYLDGLRGCSLERVARAFERCRKECEFPPRLRDLFDKMPDTERNTAPIDCGRVLKEWTIQLGSGSVAHYFETEKAGTLCRIERDGK